MQKEKSGALCYSRAQLPPIQPSTANAPIKKTRIPDTHPVKMRVWAANLQSAAPLLIISTIISFFGAPACAALGPGVPKKTHSVVARTVRKRTRMMAVPLRGREKVWRITFGMADGGLEKAAVAMGGNDEVVVKFDEEGLACGGGGVLRRGRPWVHEGWGAWQSVGGEELFAADATRARCR